MTRKKPEVKSDLPVAKEDWHPSPLAGPIVLVSSRNSQGEVHVASKSWLMMAASRPPMLALSCRLSHRTAINILETREFVINIPGEDLVARVWHAGDSVASEIEAVETPAWTFVAATRVTPPRVQECRAHIECVLDSTKRIGDDEIVFFARIVAASIDESLLKGSVEERYRGLKSLLFLEGDLYAVIEEARKLPT